jgi:hypothetical protein
VSNQVTGDLTLYSYSTLSGESGASAVTTQRLTAAQYAAGFALVSVRTNAAPWFSAPSNAIICESWTGYGIAEDTAYLPATNWSFIIGSNAVAGAHAASSGTLSFDPARPKGSPRALGLPDGTGIPLLAPLQGSFGLVPPEGRFWHAVTPTNTLFSWEHLFAARAAGAPVTFQAELLPNGDFTYRYAVPSNSLAGAVLTNFVIGAQNSGGGETYALDDPSRLIDGLELRWRAFGILDPETDDHDGDGLTTYDEVMIYGTDPTASDTDLDGLDDAAEIAAGTDAALRDSDGDGIPTGPTPTRSAPIRPTPTATGCPTRGRPSGSAPPPSQTSRTPTPTATG